ncbi:MAG: thiamine-phosphate kinase [Chitinophagales bacterium]|nr:thiamine-phosphate kinase [Chitinophagales bacterium]
MTEVSALGEFGLIQRLTQRFSTQDDSTIKGVGDDAAVLDAGKQKVVVSTDLLVEGIHFDMMYTPLKHLGYKAVVVNLSDIYAMNARPKHITVSLAISSRFTVEALEEIYEGILHACKVYNVDLVGGDTTSSLKGLIISVTAVGYANEEKIVYRNGAKVGDLIAVSGDLGAAYLGLQLLEREKRIFLEDQNITPDLESEKYLVGRQLKPEARKDIIDFFEEMNLQPTAMIDVSDGISSDILHICSQSKVGCQIYEDEIPIVEETAERALTFNLDPTTCAMNGGEDYELLFTIDEADETKLVDVPGISIIGKIVEKEEGCLLVTKGGNRVAITAQGWNHFSSSF